MMNFTFSLVAESVCNYFQHCHLLLCLCMYQDISLKAVDFFPPEGDTKSFACTCILTLSFLTAHFIENCTKQKLFLDHIQEIKTVTCISSRILGQAPKVQLPSH